MAKDRFFTLKEIESLRRLWGYWKLLLIWWFRKPRKRKSSYKQSYCIFYWLVSHKEKQLNVANFSMFIYFLTMTEKKRNWKLWHRHHKGILRCRHFRFRTPKKKESFISKVVKKLVLHHFSTIKSIKYPRNI